MTSINSTIINRKLLTCLFSKIKISTEHFYKGDPCWESTRALSPLGYTTFKWKGKTIQTHRFIYQIFVNPVPPGLDCDHLCRIRHCVNPAHIEPVTHQENCHRGESPWAINARKTHCPQGHEYTPENTVYPGKNSGRRCKTCRKQKSNIYRRNLPKDHPLRERGRIRVRLANQKKRMLRHTVAT